MLGGEGRRGRGGGWRGRDGRGRGGPKGGETRAREAGEAEEEGVEGEGGGVPVVDTGWAHGTEHSPLQISRAPGPHHCRGWGDGAPCQRCSLDTVRGHAVSEGLRAPSQKAPEEHPRASVLGRGGGAAQGGGRPGSDPGGIHAWTTQSRTARRSQTRTVPRIPTARRPKEPARLYSINNKETG